MIRMHRDWKSFVCVLAVITALTGCQTTGGRGGSYSSGGAVADTWRGGIHAIPSMATRSGSRESIALNNEPLAQWGGRVSREIVKPGVKVPAVIYAHGCKGLKAAGIWSFWFNEFGFAFFAPDSFRRPGRVAECYAGNAETKFGMRIEEIEFARQQISKLDWIDQNRIVLVGKSEGGGAVSYFGGGGFTAHIILANDCRVLNGSPAAPSGVAVLNLVGADDPREGLCDIARDSRGSQAISLPGQGHSFDGAEVAVAAVAKFLKDCCGYQPVSTTEGLDANKTALDLVKESGEFAPMLAKTNAEERLTWADKDGHAFWMRVREIAAKLTKE